MNKCPVCGSELIIEGGDLVDELSVKYRLPSRAYLNINAKICFDCGYIMSFCPTLVEIRQSILAIDKYIIESMDEYLKIIKDMPESLQLNYKKLDQLKNELNRANEIINDENQTIQAVNEAKQQIENLKSQINEEERVLDLQEKNIKKKKSILKNFLGNGFQEHLIDYNHRYINENLFVTCFKEIKNTYENCFKQMLVEYKKILIDAIDSSPLNKFEDAIRFPYKKLEDAIFIGVRNRYGSLL